MTYLMEGIQRRELSYFDYRRKAQDCDVLLWEPRNIWGRLIANGTDGPFCHVTASLWWETRLMSVGYDEKRGGVAVPLSYDVKHNPGVISVFRVIHDVDRNAVKSRLIDDLTENYQWGLILRFALLAFPLVKLVPKLRKFAERMVKKSPGAICSKHVHASFLHGSQMYLCRKPSHAVTPNDLGVSTALQYVGTLVP